MSLNCRIISWCAVLTVLGILPWGGFVPESHSDNFVKDVLLSLARPEEFPEPAARWGEEIERLLSRRSWESDENVERLHSLAAVIPFRGDYLNSRLCQGLDRGRTEGYELVPGSYSLALLRESWIRVATRGPGIHHAVRSHAAEIIDSEDAIAQVGSLVANSTGVYSRLEIEVEKAAYTLRLFAFDHKGEKKLLFTCRTGLGSPDFPTPRGSYYIIKIFDDNPLWIPPDRPWAWGEVPSHSVYGGHMMPLFDKKPLGSDRGPEIIEELDCVSGKMEFVDSGGYRVHGTNSPWSVGSGQSHGCVRLLNSSVKQLADLLKIYAGTVSRGRAPNGPYVNLARPVKLTMY